MNTSSKRGGYKIPILYVADHSGVIVNRFGDNGLFTKKTNRIEGVYNNKNEPLFSRMELLTKSGETVTITGKNIIDHISLFDRTPTPLFLNWIVPLLKYGLKLQTKCNMQ